MKKILTFVAAVLATVTSFAALPLNNLPKDTTFFTSEFWGESVSKNTTIYDQGNYFMMLTQGNALSFQNNMMYVGNSSKASAFVFRVAEASDIKVCLGYNNSDATVTLYYLGAETPEVLSSSNVSTAGTKNCGAVSITSTNLSDTIYAKSAEAGYYKVVGSLRFAIGSIIIADPTAADHSKAALTAIKLDDVALAGFSAATTSYNVVLEFDATSAPVVSAETSDDATVSITQASSVPGAATVVCKSYDESETITYTINFSLESPAPIIRATHTGATTADVKGTIGGTVDKKTQAGSKLGSNGDYFGIKLSEGTFLAGDSLVIVASLLSGGNKASLYSDKGETAIATVDFDLNTKVCSYVLTTATEWIYLYRADGGVCNANVQMMQVYRTGSNPATSIDNTTDAAKAVKVIRNGQLLIEKNGKIYNALGIEIR